MQIGERRCGRTRESSADARVCDMTRAEINLQNIVPALAFCLVSWQVLGLTICICEQYLVHEAFGMHLAFQKSHRRFQLTLNLSFSVDFPHKSYLSHDETQYKPSKRLLTI